MAGRLLGSLLLTAVGVPLAAQTPIAITHVTVIDMTGALPRPDQTVVIRGAAHRLGQTRPGARRRQAHRRSGTYLIPGLWDMHVHTTVPGGEALLSIFVANGVTGVRDMDDSLPLARAWQARIGAGTLVGPRMVPPARTWRAAGPDPLSPRHHPRERPCRGRLARRAWGWTSSRSTTGSPGPHISRSPTRSSGAG